MKLPKVYETDVPDGQRDYLRRWLREWSVARWLREADRESPREDMTSGCREPGVQEGGARSGIPTPAMEIGSEVRCGQIRLFHPGLTVADQGPFYAAALRRCGTGFLMAPCGRFSVPALPGEMATDGRYRFARVLCLWLAAVVPARLAVRSWVAGRLSARDLDCARRILQAIEKSAAAPDGCLVRVGAPLRSNVDPRHDYIEEERLRTGFLRHAGEEKERKESGLEWNGKGVDPVELRRAAEEGEKYVVP